ncbi:LysR family transcriptional regulator [Rhizobium sp.]|uniref:LysR family transcriptional regulator n=1 Tax=Rhizobium sp. TaxID=391 RepID=UPI002AA93444
MAQMPQTTVEQWSVLRAVIDHGGYAQAASALHRSQSSVSYAITRLQETVGIKLLELEGRRAVLTEAGATLLAQTIPLLEELLSLEQRARVIGGGEAPSIHILVDSIFPKPRLFRALQRFSALHPHVDVHLRETVRQTIGNVKEQDFDLAILVAEPGARWTELIANIAFIAVAHCDHPLITRPINRAMLARHAHVEIFGMEPAERSTASSGKIWSMNTVEAAISAVRQGLCYGWLPQYLIEEELQDGTLARIPLEHGTVRYTSLGLRFNENSQTTTVSALAQLLTEME